MTMERPAGASKDLLPPGLKGHIPALDGVRGTAALLVFLRHYGGGYSSGNPIIHAIGSVCRYGALGVVLFFVLSGYLITGILWDSRHKAHSLITFYTRRTLRIFPLYYLAIAIILVTATFVTGFSAGFKFLWPLFLYLQDIPYFLNMTMMHPSTLWFGHFWSLAVEEQFYLIWPFLIVKAVKDRVSAAWLCAGVFAVSLAYRTWLCADPTIPHMQLATYGFVPNIGEMAVGAFLALLVRGNIDTTWKVLRWLPAAAIVLALFIAVFFASCDPMANYEQLLNRIGIPLFSLFFGCILLLSTQPGPVRAVFNSWPLRKLGTISYGVYVYHLLFRAQFGMIATRLWPSAGYNAHLGLVAVVATVGTLTLATISYNTYESYCIGLKERWAPSR